MVITNRGLIVLKTDVQNLEDLRSDYEAYDLFMKVMHPNGIAYDIIKNSLPVINNEISKILANIVSFQIFFETDDNRLDIYIQHPDRDPSPLEMASGAEKTVAAMAIRLAFTNISRPFQNHNCLCLMNQEQLWMKKGWRGS